MRACRARRLLGSFACTGALSGALRRAGSGNALGEKSIVWDSVPEGWMEDEQGKAITRVRAPCPAGVGGPCHHTGVCSLSVCPLPITGAPLHRGKPAGLTFVGIGRPRRHHLTPPPNYLGAGCCCLRGAGPPLSPTQH